MSNKVHAFCCGYAAQFLGCLYNQVQKENRQTDNSVQSCANPHFTVNFVDPIKCKQHSEKLYFSMLGLGLFAEDNTVERFNVIRRKLRGLTQNDVVPASRSLEPNKGVVCAGNVWTRLLESGYDELGGDRYFDNGEVMAVGRPKGQNGCRGKDPDYKVTSEDSFDDILVSVVPTMGYFYEQQGDDDCELYGTSECLRRNETYKASRILTRSVRRYRVAKETRHTMFITYFVDMGALFVRAMERFINTQMFRYFSMRCTPSDAKDAEQIRKDLAARMREQEVVYQDATCVNSEDSRLWSDFEAAFVSSWLDLRAKTIRDAEDADQTSRGIKRRVANSIANIPMYYVLNMISHAKSTIMEFMQAALKKFFTSDARDPAVQIWAEIAGYLTKADVLSDCFDHAEHLGIGAFR